MLTTKKMYSKELGEKAVRLAIMPHEKWAANMNLRQRLCIWVRLYRDHRGGLDLAVVLDVFSRRAIG